MLYAGVITLMVGCAEGYLQHEQEREEGDHLAV